MKAYIKGSSAIAPQAIFEKDSYLDTWHAHGGSFMQVVPPNYRDLIDPKLSRRMSRIIKMSIATAKRALAEAKVEQPGGIVVGTALGCMADTEKFLREIVNSSEGLLSPTAFIQSTHNTIAGQIALLLGCPNYNFTYTNRGHSFENALMDAMMHIGEGNDDILVGGADETTEIVFKTFLEMGCVGDGATSEKKAIMGEGASFFVLSSEGGVAIDAVKTCSNIQRNETENELMGFLKKEGVDPSDIDALVLGHNQDMNDPFYSRAASLFEQDTPVVRFKNVSGEYFTAIAYGLHLAATMIEKQTIFDRTLVSGKSGEELNKVLIYNHYNAQSHTFILLSR